MNNDDYNSEKIQKDKINNLQKKGVILIVAHMFFMLILWIAPFIIPGTVGEFLGLMNLMPIFLIAAFFCLLGIIMFFYSYTLYTRINKKAKFLSWLKNPYN